MMMGGMSNGDVRECACLCIKDTYESIFLNIKS